MSINRVMLSGNLTRDPEIRSTTSGMNILSFGIAVNDRRRNNQTGEWEDYANFFDCVLFGNRAEFLSRALHKGIKVAIEGKLRYSSWETDGQRRSRVEVIVSDVDFISQRQQGGNGYAPQQQGQGGYGSNNEGASGGRQMYDQQDAGSFNAAAPSQGYGYQGGGQQSAPASSPAPQSRPVTAPPKSDVYDDDIPF